MLCCPQYLDLDVGRGHPFDLVDLDGEAGALPDRRVPAHDCSDLVAERHEAAEDPDAHLDMRGRWEGGFRDHKGGDEGEGV